MNQQEEHDDEIRKTERQKVLGFVNEAFEEWCNEYFDDDDDSENDRQMRYEAMKDFEDNVKLKLEAKNG